MRRARADVGSVGWFVAFVGFLVIVGLVGRQRGSQGHASPTRSAVSGRPEPTPGESEVPPTMRLVDEPGPAPIVESRDAPTPSVVVGEDGVRRVETRGHISKTSVAPRSRVIAGLSPHVWDRMLQAFDRRCRYCGRPLGAHPQKEHRVPMARSGLNVAANIVPSCAACNTLKHVATETEFVALLEKVGTRGHLPTTALTLLDELERLGDVEPRQVTMLHHVLPAKARGLGGVVPTRAVLLSPPPLESYTHFRHQEYWSRGPSAVPVAGISYRADAVSRIAGRDHVWGGWGYLTNDSCNPHDSDAVKVHIRGQFIGFLPKEIAATVSANVAALWRGSQLPVVRVWAWADDGKRSARVHLEMPTRVITTY